MILGGIAEPTSGPRPTGAVSVDLSTGPAPLRYEGGPDRLTRWGLLASAAGLSAVLGLLLFVLVYGRLWNAGVVGYISLVFLVGFSGGVLYVIDRLLGLWELWRARISVVWSSSGLRGAVWTEAPERGGRERTLSTPLLRQRIAQAPDWRLPWGELLVVGIYPYTWYHANRATVKVVLRGREGVDWAKTIVLSRLHCELDPELFAAWAETILRAGGRVEIPRNRQVGTASPRHAYLGSDRRSVLYRPLEPGATGAGILSMLRSLDPERMPRYSTELS
jgi:hypothetical protein